MDYLIGDLQGCCDPFERLLAKLDFSPSRDRIFLLGDLVNRGPDSLATLRRLRSLDGAATCLLGNHDLHLLAIAAGHGRLRRGDTVGDILAAPDREVLLDWLRHQHLAHQVRGWLLVHAGVAPQWDVAETMACAAELEAALRGPDPAAFFAAMYGEEPQRWSTTLAGPPRWRFIADALTRIRYCRADGSLELKVKEAAAVPPPGLTPWYDVPGRRTVSTPIAFGHWSTLGLLARDDLLALDTGSVWGGSLTAARLPDAGAPAFAAPELIQVRCEQAQVPGA